MDIFFKVSLSVLFHYLLNTKVEILTKYVNVIPLLKDLPFHNFIVKTKFLLKRMSLKETQAAIEVAIPGG